MIKKLGMTISTLLLAAGLQGAQAAEITTTTNPNIKVAVVNVQQVLQQSPRVAQLSKQLETQFKTRQTKISDDQKNLQTQLEKFKKESPTMTQSQRDDFQKKITSERSELVKKVMTYQQDLQKEQNKIMQNILSDLNGIVSKIATNGSYALVLDSQAVIYANGGANITTEVAKQFNAKS